MPWLREPPSELGSIATSQEDDRRHSSDLVIISGQQMSGKLSENLPPFITSCDLE